MVLLCVKDLTCIIGSNMDRQAIIMLVTAYTHNTAVITYSVSH